MVCFFVVVGIKSTLLLGRERCQDGGLSEEDGMLKGLRASGAEATFIVESVPI